MTDTKDTTTLSTSTDSKEIPKIKLALEEDLKKAAEEEKSKILNSDKMPKPTGWRLIVLPFKMREKTKGGIVLAETAIERQQVAAQTALVLSVGPDAYADKENFSKGPWCKKGDWVVFARYAGSRIQIEGGEIRLLNDDEILATIKDPEDILHQY